MKTLERPHRAPENAAPLDRDAAPFEHDERDEHNELTLGLVRRLDQALRRGGVAYCHWKSNFSLAEALAGEAGSDLDLLVDRRDLQQTIRILTELDFKPATIKTGPGTPPGIHHYYGLDRDTDRLVHVHMFTRTLTGESFIKSHLLPLENMLMNNVDGAGSLPVPSKPAELVLFVLRAFIKYGSLLDIVYLRHEAKALRDELRWLNGEGEGRLADAMPLLAQHCPVVDEKLFVRCIECLDDENSSLLKRAMLARRVRARLRLYARYSFFDRLLTYTHLLGAHAWRRLRRLKKNKVPRGGGAVIAFVGPEATGKSTMVSECERWLGGAYAVRQMHAGKPPATWLTLPVRWLFPLLRTALPRYRSTRLEGHGVAESGGAPAEPRAGTLVGLMYGLRAATIAWDRRRLLVGAWRAAAGGELVICDRYPSEVIGAMDSPRLTHVPSASSLLGRAYNALAAYEQRLYAQIPPPHIVIQLKVSIETAMARNRERIKQGKESDAYVESRHRQNEGWRRAGVDSVYDLDTEGTLPETISRAKEIIWKAL